MIMITLCEINEDNFDAIVKMEVAPEQKRFLASNAHSLAQCWLYREAGDVFPRAIHADGEPVGFLLFDADFEERFLSIWRVMIDCRHQGKGYGTEALRIALAEAAQCGRFDYATLDCSEDNPAAHVYTKLGFRPTGEINRGSVEYRLDFPSHA